MTMRVVRELMLSLPLAACGGGGAHCVAAPCPIPVAISLTIASTVSGGSVPAAMVSITGAAETNLPCNTTCPIHGYAGTYHIVVTAPGYTPAERSVQVRGTNPACGCATTVTENVTIALSESAVTHNRNVHGQFARQ